VKTKWIVLTKDIEFFKSNLSLSKEVIPKGCAILVFTGNECAECGCSKIVQEDYLKMFNKLPRNMKEIIKKDGHSEGSSCRQSRIYNSFWGWFYPYRDSHR